jgi:hypothetical protein
MSMGWRRCGRVCRCRGKKPHTEAVLTIDDTSRSSYAHCLFPGACKSREKRKKEDAAAFSMQCVKSAGFQACLEAARTHHMLRRKHPHTQIHRQTHTTPATRSAVRMQYRASESGDSYLLYRGRVRGATEFKVVWGRTLHRIPELGCLSPPPHFWFSPPPSRAAPRDFALWREWETT